MTGKQGSSTIYPIETDKQVLALCKIGSQVRNQIERGWYLWRLGWPVHEKFWRPALEDATKFLNDFLQPFLEPTEDSTRPSNGPVKSELTDKFLDMLQRAASAGISHPLGGPIKQRLGADRFASFATRCMEVLVGNFARDEHLAQNNDHDRNLTLPEILKSTFSLNISEVDVFVSVLEHLSSSVKSGTLADQLKQISSYELALARQETAITQGMAYVLTGDLASVPKIAGIPAFSLDWSLRLQALLILVWCLARKGPKIKEKLRLFYSKNGLSLPENDIF